MATSKDKYVVYKHIFPNGKVYIGITKNTLCRRWENGRGYISSRLMWRAIEKYGWDNVKHEILLSDLDYLSACEKEKEYISLYQSNNKKYGYNIEAGGNATKEIPEETRRLMSDAQKKRFKRPDKYDLLIQNGKKTKGHKVPDESRKRIGMKNKEANKHPIGRYSLDGELISVYSSASEASKILGIAKSCICRVANGERKTSLNSIWRYLERGEDLLLLK